MAWEIHAREYNLGMRDDPPPQKITDEPGTIIRYDPPNLRNLNDILKDAWASDRLNCALDDDA